MTQLSEHFALGEFTRTSHAGIDNVPDARQVENMRALCVKVLEPLRAHFRRPVEIESGFRSPQLNRAVGGAVTSQHLRGEAADISVPGVRNDDVWYHIRDKLPFDQVIAEKLRRTDPSAGWVHVSYSASQERRSAISCIGKGEYVPGLVYLDQVGR